MRNFNCNACQAPNIDSERGYIHGCKHNPPEKPGLYRVNVIDTMTGKLKWERMRFKAGCWVNQYNEVVEWKV